MIDWGAVSAAFVVIGAMLWVAYHHPVGWKRISWVLTALFSAIAFALFGYDVGVRSVGIALDGALTGPQLAMTRQVVRTFELPGWAFFIAPVLTFSLLIFDHLRSILGDKAE